MRPKIDERIPNLMMNGSKSRHRSMFVVVGDFRRDQVIDLNHLFGKTVVRTNPNFLWCHEEKRGIRRHKKAQAEFSERLKRLRALDPEKAARKSLILDVTHCFYKNLDRCLGTTYGVCIIEDFEALAPDVLARTIGAVEGGGLVVLLLRSISSLGRLSTMVRDVHERFRIESHSHVVSRFLDRFLLSLTSCKACLILDDGLNILPFSPHAESRIISSETQGHESLPDSSQELFLLKDQLTDIFPFGPLVGLSATFDQGKTVWTLLDAVSGKTLHRTLALTGTGGSGKSAALGLAVAGAVTVGYSNIFVTAPTPRNLSSLFEFIVKGLHVLKYEEQLHYDVVRSRNLDFFNAIIQINVHKQQRQTIQYIEPCDHMKLSEVELLVIDEAAAIPLPVIDHLLGPYLVFLSSTMNSYESPGCSLSLKLFQHLKEKSQLASGTNDSQSAGFYQSLELKESIRYPSGDPVASWLNDLLAWLGQDDDHHQLS